MFRTLVAGFILTGLLCATLPDTSAQEKKGQPRKKERIAVADPKEAAKDPDFAVQGEYVGKVAGADKESLGVHVIALGEGKFVVRKYRGGLPGAGWDGRLLNTATATREKGRVIIRSAYREPKLIDGKREFVEIPVEIGTIADGVMTLTEGNDTVTLKKVERKSDTLGKKPPEGAVVLFGKEGDEANWTNGKRMELSDGKFLTVAGTRSIRSKEKFGAFQAHIEFRTPWMPNSTGQGRGNSGVYLQDRYECQVLDSFGLSGENNECGGIYTQHKPRVNMCLPPLAWQTYDIEFTPAQFDSAGRKTKNARATISHNGVKIHDNVEFPKECPGGQKEEATPGPFQFQDHGDPVVYKNVWVVPLK